MTIYTDAKQIVHAVIYQKYPLFSARLLADVFGASEEEFDDMLRTEIARATEIALAKEGLGVNVVENMCFRARLEGLLQAL